MDSPSSCTGWITCPICGGSIEPLHLGIDVFARIGSDRRDIGGLHAYRCRQYAHIFFVKAQDVEIFAQSEAAISGTKG